MHKILTVTLTLELTACSSSNKSSNKALNLLIHLNLLMQVMSWSTQKLTMMGFESNYLKTIVAKISNFSWFFLFFSWVFQVIEAFEFFGFFRSEFMLADVCRFFPDFANFPNWWPLPIFGRWWVLQHCSEPPGIFTSLLSHIPTTWCATWLGILRGQKGWPDISFQGAHSLSRSEIANLNT